jgi:hypothetical protein
MVATRAPGGNRKSVPKLHPFIRWIRAAGIAAELFGWGTLVLGGWFWPGVGLIYAGFLLVIVDVWVEPELKSYRKCRIGTVLTVITFAAMFSWGIVCVKAPLEVSAIVTDAEYPAGTTIAGLAWKEEFTELQVWIVNPTNRNYDNVSVIIRPTEPVAAIAQITNIPEVSFEDKNGQSVRLMDINPRAATAGAIPLVLLATNAGYRMRCSHLPAETTIRVVLALADVKWNPPARPSQRPIEELARDKDYVLRVTFDDFSTYWYGHPDGDIYAPRPRPQWVKVEGKYDVALRTRSISQKVDVAGKITIKQP